MCFKKIIIVVLLFQLQSLYADTDSYQIPQTIYIGDKGCLVYLLDGLLSIQENMILPVDDLPANSDIVINNIEINNAKLIIDFQVFSTGIISLPPIVIKGQIFDSLEVKVSSIIANSGDAAVLSPPVQPISAPGTVWIVSGFVLIVIAIIVIILVFVFSGGTFFSELKKEIKKKRIISAAQKSIKKINSNLEKETIAAYTALTAITNELRAFMDNYFYINCISMVPVEFLSITLPAGIDEKYNSQYFYDFFMRCDNIRFSGMDISLKTVQEILTEVESFIIFIKQNNKALPKEID
jgi:hypothetical protein